MNFHILTLFPDMVMGGLGTSITGRAMESGTISVEAIDIRDYSKDKHRHVDDAPYGGGAGMVMQPGPVCEAYEALCGRIGRKPRLIYMTPQGRVFNQTIAEELAKEEDLVFLCGHYEGIDERALELIATDYLSVGDYVLTGGELPAMVMIDCISRLVPGVLNNDASAEEESFHDSLLEYPQYTRPEVFRGMEVPEVLLSGHHKNIEEWRRQQSIKRTLERRPDLLEHASLTMKEVKYLDSLRREKGDLEILEELIDQYVKSLKIDCDNDTILAAVKQVGAACHTGNRSCFFTTLAEKEYKETNPLKVFEEVFGVILDRKEHPKEGSYTNYLFDKGIDKILKKLGEEATEIVIAAKNPNPEEIKYEISDFLYHMMVLMADRGITWEEITEELANR
mgnify:CR=1 FL=1